MAVVLRDPYSFLNGDSRGAQGNIAILAVIVLTCVSVLGVSMGWMHSRGSDIFVELSRQRPIATLVEGGVQEALDKFGDLSESCEVPEDFVGDLSGFGWFAVRYVISPEDPFQVIATVTAVQGDEIQHAPPQPVNCPGSGGLGWGG